MNGIRYKKLIIIFFITIAANAQNVKLNEYGLYVVDDLKTYTLLIKKDSSKLLVDINEYIPDIILDIRYATENNFVGEAVYNTPKAFTRLPVANALKEIQEELKKENLGLKIYDAYRPYSITKRFYDIVGDPDFVASPQKGSRHNRGCAVDLTIITLDDGKELEMPTDFDDFTEKAAHNFNELPQKVLLNREKLKNVMVKNGFSIYPAEWWHYDFKGWENFELMNISFEDLAEFQTN